jgi:branched-chain amino acid transport system permease protein
MKRVVWGVGSLLVLAGLNWLIPQLFNAYVRQVMILCGINAILAVSLNLINGFTGQFSIGHAGFMAIGAYGSAMFSLHVGQRWVAALVAAGVPDGAAQGAALLLALLLGGILAGVAGYLVGLPSLRLRGDYLAIVTLGFGEIIRVLILNVNAVGGARGLPGIPGWASFFWVAAVLLVVILVSRHLASSTHGRALFAIRDDESYLNPNSFTFIKSIEVIAMVVLGGMGSISGATLAAIILTLLPEVLRPVKDYRMVIYSLMLITLMITRPQGLFGSRELSLRRLFKRGRAAAEAA